MTKYDFQKGLDTVYKDILKVGHKFNRADYLAGVRDLKRTNIQPYPWWLKVVKKIQGKSVNATTFLGSIYLHDNWWRHDKEGRSAILLHEWRHTKGANEAEAESYEQEYRKLYRKL